MQCVRDTSPDSSATEPALGLFAQAQSALLAFQRRNYPAAAASYEGVFPARVPSLFCSAREACSRAGTEGFVHIVQQYHIPGKAEHRWGRQWAQYLPHGVCVLGQAGLPGSLPDACLPPAAPGHAVLRCPPWHCPSLVDGGLRPPHSQITTRTQSPHS